MGWLHAAAHEKPDDRAHAPEVGLLFIRIEEWMGKVMAGDHEA